MKQGLMILVTLIVSTCAVARDDSDDYEGQLSAAPETWFHIIGGNASKEGIVADLDAIKDAGISGIQFFHGQGDGSLWPGVTNPIPCLSGKWVDLVKFVSDECHKRGLTFKMQNCPGWSMSGGPWITPDKAMRKLVAFEPGKKPAFDADDDYHEICEVTFDMPDASRDGELLRVFPNPQQLNHHWAYEPKTNLWDRPCPPGSWQDEVPMTFSKFGASKLDMWEAKAGWGLRRFEMSTNATPVKTVGTRTLVFGHVNAKRKNHPAPPEGTGWECDKMDPCGFEANWEGYLGKLVKAGVKIDGTLVDSWECGVQNWTWKMEEEFEKRNGYKLRPWLPALFGYVLKSEAETEKFLLDWRNTCSRLVEENYYGTIARLAHENGMTVQYETAFGDVIVGDILRYWKYADEPMCEFWSPFDNEKGFVGSHDFKAVRPCVSAAHIYGKRRVSAEAFTSFELTFDESFQEWKENANRHFARGVTHIVFHTFTHNPVVDGKAPGSSFGCGIGSPFLRLQPWWPYLKDFTKYLEVCCAEFERDLTVVDILWYLGDDVNHKPSERDDLFNNQYKYDYCNHDALLTRVDTKDGRIVLPNGMSYRVLWIPKGTFLLPATEAKIAELEKKGARVIRGELKPDWTPDFEILNGTGDLYWYHCSDRTYFIAAREKGFDGKVRMRGPSGVGGDPAVSSLHLKRGESVFLTISGCMWMDRNPVDSNPQHGRSFFRTRLSSPNFNTLELECLHSSLDSWKDGATQKTYEFSFDRPNAETVFLDLGKVCHWATVKVNGKEAARLWCEPYMCDITEHLHAGENRVEVEVTSTIYNRLVLDAAKPENERKTWTIAGPEKDAPLHEAGLLGPIVLRFLP